MARHSGERRMMPLLLLLLSVPCVLWTQGAEGRFALEAAGIKRLCSEADLASRESLPTPGVVARAGLASPTRTPWIVANGWRFTRDPAKKYVYEVPAGKASLAAVEAFAYGADAVLKIDPSDIPSLGATLSFLDGLMFTDLPVISDFGIVDDGTAATGEVMNLLARRNLLFQIVQKPSPQFRLNIRVGSAEYPAEAAGDPNAFAQKVRRELTDERRTLRIFGSEVVIARLTGDARRVRLHLINYGGRDIEGLRVRLRGTYRNGDARIAGAGRLPLQDHVAANGFTEFSIPRLITYAAVELTGD